MSGSQHIVVSAEYQSLLQSINNRAAPVVHQLVRQSPDLIHVKGWHGHTPLHKACLGGDWTIVFLLLEAGANPNTFNDCNETPVHYSCRRGNASVLHLLIQYGGDVHTLDGNQQSAAHHAAQCGSVYMMHYLLSVCGISFRCVNQKLQTPLHFICQFGHIEAFKYLMKNDRCDLSEADIDGNYPMHIAAQEGHKYICWLLVLHTGLKVLHCNNNAGKTPIDLATHGKQHGNVGLGPCLEALSKHTTLPRGPRCKWFLLLLMPVVVYGFALIVTESCLDRYHGYVMGAAVGFIIYTMIYQSHRMDDMSRWPNPIYAGAYAAGMTHTIILYVIQLLPVIYTIWPLFACSAILLVLSLFIYVRLLVTEPGILKSSLHKEDSGEVYTIKDLCVPPAKMETFCIECELVQPRRTKHCKLCERCYLDLDHHCLFLLTCIAKNNHRLFVWFIILVTLSIFLFFSNTFMYIVFTYPNQSASDIFSHIFHTNGWLLSMLFMNLGSAIWGVNLIRFQFMVISKGQTTFFRSTEECVLTKMERFLNVVYFLQGRQFFVKDPLVTV